MSSPDQVYTTFLEQLRRTDLRPARVRHEALVVRRDDSRDGRLNARGYREVGGPYQWRDKAAWNAAQWQAHACDPRLATFGAYAGSDFAGYFELRTDDGGGVEILYFGLVAAYHGRGWGGDLLTRALEAAWDLGAARVWVHTCSHDHPAALGNYLARGMSVYRVEPGAL
jgi:GNAT superfamily N-acetyltransferase